ncbi:MAG: hypothetical protein PHO20_04135 [Candidatus Peribacteraceae bacterium]|nr:hypothetical protein [Candidatus Peribacteraceae bacterium]
MSRRISAVFCLTAFLCIVPVKAADPAWYESLLSLFKDAGYINADTIAPQSPATRWKFLDLLLRLKGGVVHGPFASVTFDDVRADDPRYFLFEEGAAQGWVRGVGNCAGTHPCFAFPGRAINRAEAATLLVRAFALQARGDAPVFSDVYSDVWYAEALHIASSRCVFRGDDARETVRPDAMLNQVEMLATLARATQGLTYSNCDVGISALPPAPDTLQIQLPLPSVVPERSSTSASSVASVTTGASSRSVSLSSQSSSQTQQSASAFSSVSSGNAQVPSSNSESSSASSVMAVSDSEYAQFLDRYNEYIAAFSASLSATKFFADDTTLRVLNLLKAQMDMIAGYYQYVSIARQRVLSTGEKQVSESLRLAIEGAFENIHAIQGQ